MDVHNQMEYNGNQGGNYTTPTDREIIEGFSEKSTDPPGIYATSLFW